MGKNKFDFESMIAKRLVAAIPIVSAIIALYGAFVTTRNVDLTKRNVCFSDFSNYRTEMRKAFESLLLEFALFINEPENAGYLMRANNAAMEFGDTPNAQSLNDLNGTSFGGGVDTPIGGFSVYNGSAGNTYTLTGPSLGYSAYGGVNNTNIGSPVEQTGGPCPLNGSL